MRPLCLLLILASAPQVFAQATAERITPQNRNLIPNGKEVDAIDNDLILRNEILTAVIAQAKQGRKANMTVGGVSGALIDLTATETQSDQLSAFYPGRRAFTWASESIGTLEEDGHRYKTVSFSMATGSVQLTYALPMVDDSEINRYGLRVSTTFRNSGDAPKTIKLEDSIRMDGGKEYMGKTPNGDVDLAWVEDRFWKQAYGVVSKHGKIRSNTRGNETVLKYLVDGKSQKELAPGETFTLTRWIYAAEDLVDVRTAVAFDQGLADDLVWLAIEPKDGLGRTIENALLQIRQNGKIVGHTTVTEEDNSVFLLKGKYTIRTTVDGEKLAEKSIEARGAKPKEKKAAEPKGERKKARFPLLEFLFSGKLDIDLDIQDVELTFADYKPGAIAASITAEDGSPIPCKVELRPQDGTPKPDFGPETAEFGVKNVVYTPNGKFQRPVPSGKYDVIISRGPEYDAIFTELEVPQGKTAQLNGRLVRSVKTPGWVSCDYHSHSSPSGDNTGSQLGRVLNLAAEHIEFAPCTEHNRVSTYDGHIASQKLGRFLATISGMELTGSPLPLNHQNVFPMVYRPYQQDGGGPVTDGSPEKQIERLAAWDDGSRKLIQQNHPDIGWLFFDKNGDRKPDAGYERSFQHMDVVEIHAFGPTGPLTNLMEMSPYDVDGKGKPNRNNVVFNWLQLLNQGYRIMGITNTDAHYNFHGSGWVRNWIRSTHDEPAKIDMEEMLSNSERGRLVMSNGPYLEASLTPLGGSTVKTISGDSLTVPTGKLNAHVKVQCANWLDIDRVFILINGRPSDKYKWTREKNPDMFKDGVVKFDENISIELEDDAHIIVCTAHKTRPLGSVVGPGAKNHKPAALTNPMFINVKGDDFVPNKDTLGHPLPVKKQR